MKQATYGNETMLWKMADQLRHEGRSGIELVHWLSALVLLRWADFVDAEAEAVAAFEDEDYTPLIPNAYHWRKWHQLHPSELEPFLCHELQRAASLIRDRHHPVAPMIERAAKVFSLNSHFPSDILPILVDWLARQRFETPSDRLQLRKHLDQLLDRFDGREIGEFRTPKGICELLVGLLKPKAGEHFYDPCCGTAGFLTAAFDQVKADCKESFIRNGDADLIVSGRDINEQTCLLATARLVLSGATEARLDTGNSLEQDPVSEPARGGYDLITCNPPWGMRVSREGRHHFPVATNDATGLFVQHILGQLKPDGRAAIIVPQGFLYQKSRLGEVRRWLLSKHRLEAVVSLPDGAFQPFTGIKAAVLLLRRDGGGTRKLRMVEASNFFEKGRGKSSQLSEGKRQELLETITSGKPGEHAWDLDAEQVRKLDYDLSPVRREKSALLDELEGLGEKVEIQPLGKLCKITSGVAARSSVLATEPNPETEIPFLRIGDLQNGQINRGKSWIADLNAAKISPKKKLRAGDVLLSRSGTIGKSGVVRNGAVGGIASNGFFVLSPEQGQLDPHYLVAWLSSEICAEWLGARAQGSSIPTLRKEFLAETPVPVLPLALQQRVVEDLEFSKLDFLTQLTRIFNESADNPALRWLGHSVSQISEIAQEPVAAYADQVRTRIFGEEFRAARNWWAHASEGSDYENWMAPFSKISELLANMGDVPSGAVLASVLERVVGVLNESLSRFETRFPNESRAHRLASKCVELLRQSIESMLGRIEIEINAITRELCPGDTQELKLRVHNRSKTAVTGVVVVCMDLGFNDSIGYLAEGQEIEIFNEVTVPKDIDHAEFSFVWDAVDLLGQQHTDGDTLGFSIIQKTDSVPLEIDLGSSPYFHGPPVGPDRNDVFFGREKTIEEMKSLIRGGNTVLLEGNRRSGKSSILRHLEGLNIVPGWISVFADFQGAEGDKAKAGMPSESVWRSLAAAMIKGLVPLKIPIPMPNGKELKPGSLLGYLGACRQGIGTEAPWEDFLEFFQTILMLLEDHKLGMVLMIDEFDKLQEGIDNGVTSPQIPENIRYLIQNHPRFAAVMTGSRRMQRLRQEYWSALYGLGSRVGVSALDEDAARRLITEPVEGRLSYTSDSIQLILNLTARQPFLIQYLCNRIFSLAAERQLSTVTRTIVDESAVGFVKDNEHFASLWEYIESDRCRLIVLLCHQLTAEPDPVTFGVLKDRLHRDGVLITDAQLEADLVSLRELELIDFSGAKRGSIYKLTVPLMGQWLDEQQEYAPLLAKTIDEQEQRL
jgi:type I restriction enzyme M protein